MTLLNRRFGVEIAAMRNAFFVEHGYLPTRVLWSEDIEAACIEQERRINTDRRQKGLPPIEPSSHATRMLFDLVPGENVLYVDGGLPMEVVQ